MLAALNHPNIAAIHGLEEFGDMSYLVLELVPGETLAEWLAARRLSVEEALRICRQIAEALEAAHEKGIIHRDLKPANIKVTPEGKVKVLDFGLAKAFAGEGAGIDLSHASTQSAGATVEGQILGTPGYMSPEQVRGKPVDKRTDIWSFGCVLYEALTRRQTFAAETVSDIIAKILETQPNWQMLPDTTPASIQVLLHRCLEKDPHRRLHDVADARIEIGDALTSPAYVVHTGRPSDYAAPHRRWWLGIAGVATLLLVAGVSGWLARRTASSAANPLANATFTRLTNFEGAEHGAVVSPDGKWVAFRADRDGPFDVWLSQIGTGRFLNLTKGKPDEGGRYPERTVGFSGDGSEICLYSSPDNRLRLVPLMGGTSRVFLGEGVINAAWSADGARLVYHTLEDGDPIFVADRIGASPRRIFAGPSAGWHNHFLTWSLDGRWIYFVRYFATPDEMDLWRLAATGGAPERLTQHNSDVAYPAPIDNRTVLYVAQDQDGSGPWLWALDVERKLTFRVSFGLEKYTSVAASANGRRLVATVANPSASLWSVSILDRPAEEHDVRPFLLPSVNPIAPRFGAVSLYYLSGDGLWRYQDGQALQIWKGADGTLLEPPAVSPDGRRVAIVLRRSGKLRLHVLSGDGAEIQPFADTLEVRGTACWSPDAKWIVTGGNDASGPGLFKIPVEGGAPVRLVAVSALNPVWSPDGSLIIYASKEVSGDMPLLAVSPDGTSVKLPAILVFGWGEHFRFLPNGKALVYMQRGFPSQDFWLLDLVTKKTRQLTQLYNSATMRTFDITPDGKQIVFDRLRENSDIVLIDLPK
jgi:Tol biopolymer transport system component